MEIKIRAKIIEDAGGRLYLVGGSVRDEMLNREINDRDYCVTGIDVNTFLDLFPNATPAGIDFPVFILDGEEYALARTEKKICTGYKGFNVYINKSISIEEDLKRRDITINAMAKDVLTGKIIDPYGGKKDLENKIIRHVSDAFSEDPLRVYRVARLAAKLNFNVHPDTINKMFILKKELKELRVERVFLELRKALKTEKPSKFFKVLKESNTLNVHFIEIQNLVGVPQPEKYHPEGDVFNHTMLVLDTVREHTTDTSVLFAALVHDLGKAKTKEEILPSHHGHDLLGVEEVKTLAKRLSLPTSWKKKGIETAKYHMRAGTIYNMKPYKIAKFFNVLQRSSIGIDDLEIITQADDMLHRPNTKFADLAHETLKNVNGKTLIQSGISIEKVGKDRFLDELYKKQANYIKKYIDNLKQNMIK